MANLTLKIGQIDRIAVCQQQTSDTRSPQIQGNRTAQPPRADDQNGCIGNARLSCYADIGQQNVPAVPKQLIISQIHGWQRDYL